MGQRGHHETPRDEEREKNYTDFVCALNTVVVVFLTLAANRDVAIVAGHMFFNVRFVCLMIARATHTRARALLQLNSTL